MKRKKIKFLTICGKEAITDVEDYAQLSGNYDPIDNKLCRLLQVMANKGILSCDEIVYVVDQLKPADRNFEDE